jgi:hypothetical protein
VTTSHAPPSSGAAPELAPAAASVLGSGGVLLALHETALTVATENARAVTVRRTAAFAARTLPSRPISRRVALQSGISRAVSALACFECLGRLIAPQRVRMNGAWTGKPQRRYASPHQLGSGEGPFIETIDWRW